MSALLSTLSIFTSSLAILTSLSIFRSVSLAFSVVNISRPFNPALKSYESLINEIYLEC